VSNLPGTEVLVFVPMNYFQKLFQRLSAKQLVFSSSVLMALILSTNLAQAQAQAQVQNQNQAQTQEPEVSSTTDYTLAPGDLINIAVYEEPQLSFQVKLGATGIVNYPFIGEVMVTGKTTNQVGSLIRDRLVSGEFFVHPEVTVNVLAYRPFYIEGAVNSPGSYAFEPGLTLRKVISMAGGYTERASRSNISIVRNSKPLPLNDKMLDEPIRPDDIITVAERFF
jgi:polysaccharide biosynthesis/export protein VpsN